MLNHSQRSIKIQFLEIKTFIITPFVKLCANSHCVAHRERFIRTLYAYRIDDFMDDSVRYIVLRNNNRIMPVKLFRTKCTPKYDLINFARASVKCIIRRFGLNDFFLFFFRAHTGFYETINAYLKSVWRERSVSTRV